MLIEKVIKTAQPYLKGLKIRDTVIGISLIGMELDNGYIGISYVLRESLNAGCSIFPYVQQIIGRDASDIAQWAVSGGDDLQRSIGIAVLGAASQSQSLQDFESPETPFGLTLRKTDTIGMIGFIEPVAKIIRPHVKEIHIFDEGISQRGGTAGVLPMEEQSRLLPACDIVILSGTTMINGTVDKLLDMSANAREIMMIGSSTPMYPEAFSDTKVTVLAGSWWKNENKAELFKKISLACGISQLRQYAIKKSVRV